MKNDKRWFLYIIKTKNNTLYTGVAINLLKRWRDHLELKKGAKYLKANPPFEMVHWEGPMDKKVAFQLESKIKKLSAKDKKRYISEKKSILCFS